MVSGQKDIRLKDGDRVFIASKYSREPVYVWGEVKEARTTPYYEGFKLMKALRDIEFQYDIRELKAVIYWRTEKGISKGGEETRDEIPVPPTVDIESVGQKTTFRTETRSDAQRVPQSEPLPRRKVEVEVSTVQREFEAKTPIAEIYLYDFFVLSVPEANVELKPGARVVIQRTFKTEKVPTVTVLGQVLRPGKYELKKRDDFGPGPEALRWSGRGGLFEKTDID